MSRIALALALASWTAVDAAAQAGPAGRAVPNRPATPPSLVVLITVDQLRADYLTRFSPQLTAYATQ